MAINPLSEIYTPQPTMRNISRRDTVLNLSDLSDNRIDTREFFEENYDGLGRSLMRQILTGMEHWAYDAHVAGLLYGAVENDQI